MIGIGALSKLLSEALLLEDSVRIRELPRRLRDSATKMMKSGKRVFYNPEKGEVSSRRCSDCVPVNN